MSGIVGVVLGANGELILQSSSAICVTKLPGILSEGKKYYILFTHGESGRVTVYGDNGKEVEVRGERFLAEKLNLSEEAEININQAFNPQFRDMISRSKAIELAKKVFVEDLILARVQNESLKSNILGLQRQSELREKHIQDAYKRTEDMALEIDNLNREISRLKNGG